MNKNNTALMYGKPPPPKPPPPKPAAKLPPTERSLIEDFPEALRELEQSLQDFESYAQKQNSRSKNPSQIAFSLVPIMRTFLTDAPLEEKYREAATMCRAIAVNLHAQMYLGAPYRAAWSAAMESAESYRALLFGTRMDTERQRLKRRERVRDEYRREEQESMKTRPAATGRNGGGNPDEWYD